MQLIYESKSQQNSRLGYQGAASTVDGFPQLIPVYEICRKAIYKSDNETNSYERATALSQMKEEQHMILDFEKFIAY